MKAEKETIVHITMTEAEAHLLLAYLQNPPLDFPERKMLESLFYDLRSCLTKDPEGK